MEINDHLVLRTVLTIMPFSCLLLGLRDSKVSILNIKKIRRNIYTQISSNEMHFICSQLNSGSSWLYIKFQVAHDLLETIKEYF